MKKIAFHVLTIAYILMFVAISIQLFTMNWNIEKNIVKIIKEAEIIHDFENNLDADNNNSKENIFSGFFIDEYTIITVAHWVNKENSIYTVYDFEWNEYKAFLKEKDTKNDIAYLEINKKYEKFRKTKYVKELKEGEKIYIQNFNKEKKEGEVSSINDKKISSNIIFEEWDSGSPLLNERWRLIGINIELDLNNNEWVSYKLFD